MPTNYSVGWFSDRSILIRSSDAKDVASLEERIAEFSPGLQVRRGLDSILVSGSEPDPDLLDRVQGALDGYSPSALKGPGANDGTPVTVPVVYDGEDLDEVAATCGLSTTELVHLHTETLWTVSMIGFAPGFPYLSPIDGTEFVKVPRRLSPRPSVPAGSVAIAAGLTCIYPSSMPGGWWLIGNSDLNLFDPSSETPALLSPGDLVRFRVAE